MAAGGFGCRCPPVRRLSSRRQRFGGLGPCTWYAAGALGFAPGRREFFESSSMGDEVRGKRARLSVPPPGTSGAIPRRGEPGGPSSCPRGWECERGPLAVPDRESNL